jgi:hypothetical protein
VRARKTIIPGAAALLGAVLLGAVLLGAVLLALVLAGCGDTAGTSAPQPTATSGGSVSGTVDTPTAAPTVKPAPSPTGPGAQSGVADICAQSASVTVRPPSNIPSYPNAQLHISQVDPSNSNNVFYGFCTSASVQDVLSFYQQQLPGKGWGSLKTYSIDTVRQVRAAQGGSQLTVSIAPSAVLSGTTNIAITVIGG